MSPTEGATLGGGLLVQCVAILSIAAWTGITLAIVPPGGLDGRVQRGTASPEVADSGMCVGPV